MKVKFIPQNIEIEISPNESVMDVGHKNGLHIKSVCKGVPSCAECRVRVAEGEYNVLPPSYKELELIGNSFFVDQRRLSCQLRCFGDITVDLSEQLEKADRVVKRPRGARGSAGQVQGSQAKLGGIMFEEGSSEAADSEATVEAPVAGGDFESQPKTYERDLLKAEVELMEEETRRALQELRSRKRK
ncbi:MAG: hypothetical protein COT74_01025 [Bdellovibrionales bacterium CG10_big_fil_rev_8_21_14_0_10_45_34]|nr:MAG: hypothetical protein COT74_01025 [Bdellovibrionales bacterium CG10_big_fil_rev_8_21_14_0_10_45_34]